MAVHEIARQQSMNDYLDEARILFFYCLQLQHYYIDSFSACQDFTIKVVMIVNHNALFYYPLWGAKKV